MCTVCNDMFIKGITDLNGHIRKKEGIPEDMKVHIALSLEPNPVLNIRLYDRRDFTTLYEEHIGIRYCPFCGQKLYKELAE